MCLVGGDPLALPLAGSGMCLVGGDPLALLDRFQTGGGLGGFEAARLDAGRGFCGIGLAGAADKLLAFLVGGCARGWIGF